MSLRSMFSDNDISGYSILAYRARDLPKAYINMIYSRWMRSLRHGNDYIKLMDGEAYYSFYKLYIDKILSQDNAEVRLAALSDEPDVVLGFSVSRGNILDYVHVHKDNRKLGIGTWLIPPGIDTITHLTKTGLTIWGNKHGSWKFNAFV